MSSFEDAVDRLYQSPLPAFIAERRALAKRQPARAHEVNALQKPTLPAWAVNQLFWTKRKTIEQVTRAAERMRDGQLQRLSGKAIDPAPAELAHRAAIERAVREASALLDAAGEPASPATLQAVRETLQTVPWTRLDGRLVRPSKPTGLEGLAALMKGNRPPARPPAKVLPMRRPAAPAGHAAEAAARAAEQRRRKELAALDRQSREAEAALKRTRAAASRAAEELSRAEKVRAQAEAALERARTLLDERRRSAREAEQAAAEAVRTRDALRAQLDVLRRTSP